MRSYKIEGSCRLAFWDEDAALQGREAPITEIDAVIPGNVEIDMMRANLLPDIYFGNNILLLRPYEYYAWKYTVSFDAQPAAAGEKAYLAFEGVDCFADYELNGIPVGHTEDALMPHRIEVSDALKAGENILTVLIHSPMLAAESMPRDAYDWAFAINYESLQVRKAPSSYGWDIMPRALSAGIWRGIRLEYDTPNEIRELYLSTYRCDKNKAQIICALDAVTDVPHRENLSVKITGRLRGEVAFTHVQRLFFPAARFDFTVKNPELWWPLGYGDSPVYDVTASLMHGDEVLAEKTVPLGIRTLKLEHTDEMDDFSGTFRFVCNGVPVYARGSNWVPLDAMHSRDAERYEKVLAMFRDTRCNMLRCWGGNVYEDDAFFDICDRSGIMVWQDYAMACAFYPLNETFLNKVREEAETVVKKLRNHPSIALWSGDNECDGFMWSINQLDPEGNLSTRHVLPEVIRRCDPFRSYLPSSPYVSKRVLEHSLTKRAKPGFDPLAEGSPYNSILPEDHPWGPRDYFKSPFYSGQHEGFISEIGYHGMSSIPAMKSFLPEDKMWPWQGNDMWLTHAAEMTGPEGSYAYRIKLMADQIHELFGFDPDNLEDFALGSQISQAEAFKYFVESGRMRKGECWGVIWWNMIDGWPQFSDAVVTWDFHKKLAYHFIKESQQLVQVMMSEPGSWSSRLFAANDTLKPQHLVYRLYDGETGETIVEGETDLPANETVQITSFRTSFGEQRLYLMEWEADGVPGFNHFIHGRPPFRYDDMKKWLRIIADHIADADLEETLAEIMPKEANQ